MERPGRDVRVGAVPGRPLRVARVITRLNIGGPAWHALLLTAGMDRTRFATTLIAGTAGRAEGDLVQAGRARGVEPLFVPELGRPIRPGRDLAALGKLLRIFRGLRPDLVHTHMAKAGSLGRLAARLAGVPATVHTFHGQVLEGYFSRAASWLFLRIERGLARRTDRILTLSPRLREDLLGMGIGRPEQVEVVPLGLELDRFRAVARDARALRGELGLPAASPLLGIVGRLVPIKDHATLFAALAQLDGGATAPHLVVVGDGERRADLERLALRLGLAGRIHFLGWRHDLEAILAGLDVVVSSSLNEGTPVALIEAMAAGVPVVSTDVGGVRDLIEDGTTGWLAPPRDPGALAGAIRRVLGDTAHAGRMAAAARALVLERHHVAGLIRRMEALYTTVWAETQRR